MLLFLVNIQKKISGMYIIMRPLNNLNMIGALIAIIFINVNFGNKAGTPPALAFNYYPYIRNGSLFINDTHIHHWLICFSILIFTLPLQITNKSPFLRVFNGFLFTLMVQGLLYEDRFDF